MSRLSNDELATRFRRLVLDKGRSPRYHDEQIEKLRTSWTMLYALIKEVQNEDQ